jgi:hypothetical protein
MADRRTPRSDEEALSKLPALKLLITLGWEYLPPAEANALRGGRRSEVLLFGVLEQWLRENNRIEYRGESVPFAEANIAAALPPAPKSPAACNTSDTAVPARSCMPTPPQPPPESANLSQDRTSLSAF